MTTLQFAIYLGQIRRQRRPPAGHAQDCAHFAVQDRLPAPQWHGYYFVADLLNEHLDHDFLIFCSAINSTDGSGPTKN